MRLQTIIKNRDHTDRPLPLPVLLKPVRYSWNAIGGPEYTEVEVAGWPTAVWEIVELLRCPLELWDLETMSRVWWGYIAEVEIRHGNLTIGVSLDSMANSIAVAYTETDFGTGVSLSDTTSYATDAASIAEYGTKQLMGSLADASEAQAENARATVLAERKYPIPVVRVTSDPGSGGTIRGRGWWDTLGWKYYTADPDTEEYTTQGAATQLVGSAAATTKAAQSFQLLSTTAWDAEIADIIIAKIGAPTDNVVVTICSDTAGSPGATLATATIAGSTLTTTLTWTYAAFAAVTTLSPSTTYWLVVARSGANDASNHYTIQVNEALGYARGSFKVYDSGGATWGARSPDADMNFSVVGSTETTIQIGQIGATAQAGQFMTAVQIDNASGIKSSAERDGKTTGLDEIANLLKSGTTANKRLLATVTQERILQVYVEPTSDAATDYYMTADGRVWTALNTEVRPETCPVAFWARLRDAVPPTADISKIANPSPFFVERSEVDITTGRLTLEPRSIDTPWDVGMVTEG